MKMRLVEMTADRDYNRETARIGAESVRSITHHGSNSLRLLGDHQSKTVRLLENVIKTTNADTYGTQCIMDTTTAGIREETRRYSFESGAKQTIGAKLAGSVKTPKPAKVGRLMITADLEEVKFEIIEEVRATVKRAHDDVKEKNEVGSTKRIKKAIALNHMLCVSHSFSLSTTSGLRRMGSTYLPSALRVITT